jgi:2,3,4,5-tetrahydropyridine-2-carboxylate N-succinyltransferase
MIQLQQKIDKYFSLGEINEELKKIVSEVFSLINNGKLRVCEKINNQWQVNQWVKKAILLSFKINNNQLFEVGNFKYFDKVPLKFQNWTETDFQEAGFRAVAGSIIRDGVFIEKNVVLMPSFVNIGAYVGEGTMVDSWATVGSCAQIGKNCHISGGAGIGGVLEPLQANPVIIEDNCFIGARSEIVEGVIVGKGSVISMGVYVGQSTKIVDRETGKVSYGKIPEYSVVVPGSIKTKGDISLNCAVIIKRVDEKTRSKTGINELLRD